jgi:glycosyltransferase involved in cell wall biosynthesis
VEVSVVIGTFGADRWKELAKARAIPSVPNGVPVIHKHDKTLAKARNAGLVEVETEFTIHLDADDELASDYIDKMATGTADLRGPSLQRIAHGKPRDPYVPQVWGHWEQHEQCFADCLRYGNWLVIGTCVRTELAKSVGWEEFGWSEDWAFFARCWKAGGTVEAIPEAVYRAYWQGGSRNRVSNRVGLRWHKAIEAAVWPEEPSTLVQ